MKYLLDKLEVSDRLETRDLRINSEKKVLLLSVFLE